MTINQYADFAIVTRPTVYKWIKEGKLLTERTPSGKYRIIGVKNDNTKQDRADEIRVDKIMQDRLNEGA